MKLSNLLIGIGIVLILFGLFTKLFHIRFFHLPGDIVIKKDNFTFYLPITTSILLSLLISFVFYILSKFK